MKQAPKMPPNKRVYSQSQEWLYGLCCLVVVVLIFVGVS